MNIDEIELIIRATDRDGDGNPTEMPILIKKLNIDYYTMISLNEKSMNNLDEIVEKFEREMKVKLHVLSAANVPGLLNESSKFYRSSQTILRIIICAFDDKNNPIPSQEIER